MGQRNWLPRHDTGWPHQGPCSAKLLDVVIPGAVMMFLTGFNVTPSRPRYSNSKRHEPLEQF